MAEYTIELKDIVATHNIFDFKYPFYDERKRHEFEQKFIRHFYFREIGCETIDRFKIYLEDKMNTVFPYYNKLFEAATVEYDLLNNYNLTEEFETTRKNQGKTAGSSSTVGQLFGSQESESEQNRVVDTIGNNDTIGKDTETETTVSTTDETGNSVTDSEETVTSENANLTTVEGNHTKTTSETVDTNKNRVEKFLDTPQGLTNLTNSNYLTNLTQVDETEGQEREVTENGTDGQTTESNGTSETTTNGNSETNTTGNSETNTTRNGEKNTLVNQETTGKETTNDKVAGTVKDEQKTTQDNNTRTYMEGEQTETHKLTRIGNIGVQTGADMIRIHVELQKTLRNIERMFFDDCEDLFMMVY